MNNMHVIFK